jgi:hypothetical protein
MGTRSPILLLLAAAVHAQTAMITSGAGDCTASVLVDAYGFYGSAGNANLMLDPAGAQGPTGTTFQSALFLHSSCGIYRWLATSAGFGTAALPGLPLGTPDPRTATSSGTIPGAGAGVDFTLTQTLTGPDGDCGTTLRQSYTFTNRTGATCDLCLVRYVDTDLRFDNSISDRSGTSVSMPGPPWTPNGHWVFAYDAPAVLGPMYGITAEGLDAAGLPVATAGWSALPFSTLRTGITTTGCAALTNVINGDVNGDLLNLPGETPFDTTMAIAVPFPAVAPGQTVTLVTRTRLATRTPQGMRDMVPNARAGSLPGSPLLHFAGLTGLPGGCLPVGGGGAVTLAAPPGNATAHYVLFVHAGRPVLGNLCGAPGAADFAQWSIPGLGAVSDAAMNAGAWFLSGAGGASTPAFALASSIASLAAILTPPAAGGPPGSLVFPLPPLPAIGITVQAIIVDLSGPPALRLTNALELTGGGCACQP